MTPADPIQLITARRFRELEDEREALVLKVAQQERRIEALVREVRALSRRERERLNAERRF